MKTKQFYAIFAIIFTLNTTIAQIPTENLIGYYPFSGSANDFSGKSNNGTVYGASLTNDRFENNAKAYYFNGLNDFISLPSSFDVLARTINLWIYYIDTNYYDSYGAVYQSDHPYLIYGNNGIAVKTINGDN